MFITILNWIKKTFNEILFEELMNFQNFSPTHFKLLFWFFAVGLGLLFVYRFFAYKNRTRTVFLKTTYIIIACLLAFFLIYTETFQSNFERNYLSLNFVHFLYTFLPLSIRYIGFIFIGILIFSKKEHKLIGNFSLAILPFVALITIISVDNFAIRDSFFIYFATNFILFFFPIYLAVFRKIKPELKYYVYSYMLLVGILLLSYVTSITLELILPHSQRYQLYNYNYVIFPCTQYVRMEVMKYSNAVLLAFYNLIPVPVIYLLLPILIVILINCAILWVIRKKKFVEDIKCLFTHPIKFLFPRKIKYEVIG